MQFRITPFFSDAAFCLVHGQALYVFGSMPNRVGITVEQVGDILHTAVSELLRFHGRITAAILR